MIAAIVEEYAPKGALSKRNTRKDEKNGGRRLRTIFYNARRPFDTKFISAYMQYFHVYESRFFRADFR